MNEGWVLHNICDEVVDFVRCWSDKSEISVGRFIVWLGISTTMFYNWRRYGRVHENAA